jgi:hypothetical protein
MGTILVQTNDTDTLESLYEAARLYNHASKYVAGLTEIPIKYSDDMAEHIIRSEAPNYVKKIQDIIIEHWIGVWGDGKPQEIAKEMYVEYLGEHPRSKFKTFVKYMLAEFLQDIEEKFIELPFVVTDEVIHRWELRLNYVQEVM